MSRFKQVQRLLLRHKFIHEVDFRKGLCSGPMALEVVFKRIFVNDIDEIRTHDSETMENVR